MPPPLASATHIGLALGSGGARGLAHIGVLQALHHRGIRPALYAGTSMGAIVAAFANAGRLDDLLHVALGLDWRRLLHYADLTLARGGLLHGAAFHRELLRLLGVRHFSALPYPFRAVATNLLQGTPVILGSGDLPLAIRASASIPGLFLPVRAHNAWLVDGGLSLPVPVSVARSLGADFVIAVDVTPLPCAPIPTNLPHNTPPQPQPHSRVARWLLHMNLPPSPPPPPTPPPQKYRKNPSLPKIMAQTIRIAEARIAAASLRENPPDLLIRPSVGTCGLLDFHQAPALIRAGYHAALLALQPKK